jgi:alpha-tubulin suppressor-like RCC1 family protein
MALSASVWLGRPAPALAQDIYAWGERYGPTPMPVHNLAGGIFALAAGAGHSLATNGEVVCAWGSNASGQLGDGTTTDRLTPVAVQSLSDVVSIAAGRGHSLAIGPGLGVWAWGNNDSGQLGDGTFRPSRIPVQVQNLTDVLAIAAGIGHSLAHP